MKLLRPYIFIIALFITHTAFGQGVGTPDSSFGINGIVTTPIGNTLNRVNDMVLQADGKIILAGAYVNDSTGTYDIAIARYLTGGTLDSGFGTNGIVTKSIGPGNDGAHGVVVQADNKIVIAGSTANVNATYTKWVLCRYTADGSPDSTYGTNGITITDLGTSCEVSKMALQSDGKVVVVGVNGVNAPSFLVRYTTNGTPDSSFGNNGIVMNNDGRFLTSVKLQPDGKILVGGAMPRIPSFSDCSVFRYLSNGVVDNTFGINGIARISIGNWGEEVSSIALQPDGKIVAVGSALLGSDDDVAMVRFDSNGTIDNSFHNGAFSLNTGNDDAYGVVVLPDGKIVVACTNQPPPNYTTGIELLRFDTNGNYDYSFGTAGKVKTNVPTSDVISCMARQPDGKIILGGFIWNAPQEYFFMIRYNLEIPTPTPSGVCSVDNSLSMMSVFPNPVANSLSIELKDEHGIADSRYELIDVAGKVLLSGKLEPGKTNRINTSALNKGIYLLSITNNGQRMVRKIVKE